MEIAESGDEGFSILALVDPVEGVPIEELTSGASAYIVGLAKLYKAELIEIIDNNVYLSHKGEKFKTWLDTNSTATL